MEKCGQSMLLVAVLLSADSGDDGQHFSPLSAAFFGLLRQGLSPVVPGSSQFISPSCGHTHDVKDCAPKTTNNNTSKTPKVRSAAFRVQVLVIIIIIIFDLFYFIFHFLFFFTCVSFHFFFFFLLAFLFFSKVLYVRAGQR